VLVSVAVEETIRDLSVEHMDFAYSGQGIIVEPEDIVGFRVKPLNPVAYGEEGACS
jgi:hypothetical protein